MTKASAEAEKRVASAGGDISLVRIKSSDGGLRTLLLAVAKTDNILLGSWLKDKNVVKYKQSKHMRQWV